MTCEDTGCRIRCDVPNFEALFTVFVANALSSPDLTAALLRTQYHNDFRNYSAGPLRWFGGDDLPDTCTGVAFREIFYNSYFPLASLKTKSDQRVHASGFCMVRGGADFSGILPNLCLLTDEYVNCPLRFDDRIRPANLLPIHMLDFDVILGMDWLASHRATIDCYARTVIFGNVRQHEFVYHGSSPLKSVKSSSAMRQVPDFSWVLKQLKEMLENGFIRLVFRQWGALVLFIMKKDGEHALVRHIMDPSRLILSPKWPRTYYGDGGEGSFAGLAGSFKELKTEIGVCSDIDSSIRFWWCSELKWMHRRKDIELAARWFLHLLKIWETTIVMVKFVIYLQIIRVSNICLLSVKSTLNETEKMVGTSESLWTLTFLVPWARNNVGDDALKYDEFKSSFLKGLQKAWGTRLKFCTEFSSSNRMWHASKRHQGKHLSSFYMVENVVALYCWDDSRSRQKSYDAYKSFDVDLEFQVGDRVFLKVSPFRGVNGFGIKGSSDLIQPDMSLSEEPESILDRPRESHEKQSYSFCEDSLEESPRAYRYSDLIVALLRDKYRLNHDESYDLEAYAMTCEIWMVTTRRNSDDDIPNFEAMITAAVANAFLNLTAA
ncbi:putative reverse transcriptase domain-containing protein [Tanacetum coccineum]